MKLNNEIMKKYHGKGWIKKLEVHNVKEGKQLYLTFLKQPMTELTGIKKRKQKKASKLWKMSAN